MGVLNRNVAGSARLVSYVTGPPGYIAWRAAGTKSGNLAQPCLKLSLQITGEILFRTGCKQRVKTCVPGRRKRKLHLVFEFCELTVLNELEKHPKGVPMQQTKSIVWQTLQVQHMCSHCILIVTKLFLTCEILKS